MERQVGILYMKDQMILIVLSNQELVIMVTNAQHNFLRGLLSTMKRGKQSVSIKRNAPIWCHNIIQQAMPYPSNLSVIIKK
jgi:hypothetical protein